MSLEIQVEYIKKKAKKSNIIGMRASYGLSLLNIKEKIEELSVFTADTSTSAGLDRFKTIYPESFFDCGISEQSMIAMAAGFVAEGGRAIASTFAPFLILRAAEQIRLSLGYMKLPVVVTGLASGLSLGYLGYTHCCVEDLPYILNIPNIYVYSPSDAFELQSLLPHIINRNSPTYIRLTGASKVNAVHSNDFSTDLSSPIPIVSNGSELLILSTGAISSNAKDAIDSLEENELSRISHYVVPFFDGDKTMRSLKNLSIGFKNILILDESMFGGLASYFQKSVKDSNSHQRTFFRTHPDKYLKCGSYDYMLSQCNLDKESISKTIVQILNN